MNLLGRINAFHKNHRVLTHFFFWLGILLISTEERNYYYREDWFSLNTYLYNGLTIATQAMTSYFLAYLIIPRLFKTKKYLQVLLMFLAGMYLICVLSRVITIYIQEPLSGVAPKKSETPVEIFTNFSKLIYLYFFRNFSVALIFLLLKSLKDQNDILQRSLLLQKEKSAAELQILKNQLHPHFLFNTLNNIYSLSVCQSEKTSESIERLSEMLDHILNRCNSQFVPLSNEINLLKNYIELERLRYDNRLRIHFTTACENEYSIAPMLLLTIVENAFKHGASQKIDDPVIDIDLRADESSFHFKVKNSYDPDTLHHNGKKIGLRNLRQQLELIYPHRHTLHIAQTGQLFIASLTIQL